MATLIGRILSVRRPISLGITNFLNRSGANRLEAQKSNMCTYAFVKRLAIQMPNIKNYCSAGNSDILNDSQIELKNVKPSDHTFLNLANTMHLSLDSVAPTKTIENASNKKKYDSKSDIKPDNINGLGHKTKDNRNFVKKSKKHLFSNQLQVGLTKDRTAKNKISNVLQTPSLSFAEVLDRHPAFFDKYQQNDMEANKIFDKAAKFYEDKREAEIISHRKPEYAIDWNSAMAMVKQTETQLPPKIISREELDAIPINRPTFNISKIIEDCPSLQRLVDLGVDLSVWEDNVYGSENMEIALRLNFDVDVKPIMLWLMEKGVDIRDQAALFTRNPQIFKKTLDEMNNAIEYLKSKDFARQGIKEILIGSHGRWLNFSVVEIDSKLGYFQRNFGLSGNEVRKLSMKEPNLIIWTGAPFQVNLNHITIVDGMGFKKHEAKALLLQCPRLYSCKVGEKLQSVFDVVHHTIGLSHETILQHPYILLKNRLLLKSRHLFLEKLGRNQYDPKKPNFISPHILCEENDAEFCELGAGVPVDLYNKFLLSV